MAAQPTPVIKVFWDGTRGTARFYCAWTASATLDILDATFVDISTLDPRPPGDRIKVRDIQVMLNGDFLADIEFKTIAAGTVDTGDGSGAVAWVSGDKFSSTWITEESGRIFISEGDYTITSVTDDENMVVVTPPTDGAAFDYTIDQLIDRFVGQSNRTNPIERDYRDGPSGGCQPDDSSSSFIGDIVVSSSGAASGDELEILMTFQRT